MFELRVNTFDMHLLPNAQSNHTALPLLTIIAKNKPERKLVESKTRQL
jgi:hypothetical protein